MPVGSNNYDIGTDEWWYNLYSDFWDTESGIYEGDFGNSNFGEGSYGEFNYGYAPSVSDFQQGYISGPSYQFAQGENWQDYLNLEAGSWYPEGTTYGEMPGYNPLYGGNPWEEVGYDPNFAAPSQQWNEAAGTWQVGTFLNLSDWLSQWDQYRPQFNFQNVQDAWDIGLLEKDKALQDVFAKGRSGKKYLHDILYGQDTSDSVYDRALGVGRLSDFSNLAHKYAMEQGYANTAYDSLTEMLELGAFSSGPINQGSWQTTVGGGWGDEAVADNTDACHSYCWGQFGEAGPEYGNCMASCAATGMGGV